MTTGDGAVVSIALAGCLSAVAWSASVRRQPSRVGCRYVEGQGVSDQGCADRTSGLVGRSVNDRAEAFVVVFKNASANSIGPTRLMNHGGSTARSAPQPMQ